MSSFPQLDFGNKGVGWANNMKMGTGIVLVVLLLAVVGAVIASRPKMPDEWNSVTFGMPRAAVLRTLSAPPGTPKDSMGNDRFYHRSTFLFRPYTWRLIVVYNSNDTVNEFGAETANDLSGIFDQHWTPDGQQSQRAQLSNAAKGLTGIAQE